MRQLIAMTALAVLVSCGASAQVETGRGGWEAAQRLAATAYTSSSCREAAAALSIPQTRDAETLVAAFVRRKETARAEGKSDLEETACGAPQALLVSLLRLNGVEAELAFVSTRDARESRAPEKIDRVLVFIPALRRYVDAQAPLARAEALDRTTRMRAARMHLVGPSLVDAPGACRDLCMYVVGPDREGSAVPVRTEVIRGR